MNTEREKELCGFTDVSSVPTTEGLFVRFRSSKKKDDHRSGLVKKKKKDDNAVSQTRYCTLPLAMDMIPRPMLSTIVNQACSRSKNAFKSQLAL